MNFLPESPKKRQMILIIGGIVACLIAFGFFYITYFSSKNSADSDLVSVQDNAKIKSLSEDTIRNLEINVTDIQKELDQKFYKNLKPYSWQKDSATPGNNHPFFAPNNQ